MGHLANYNHQRSVCTLHAAVGPGVHERLTIPDDCRWGIYLAVTTQGCVEGPLQTDPPLTTAAGATADGEHELGLEKLHGRAKFATGCPTHVDGATRQGAGADITPNGMGIGAGTADPAALADDGVPSAPAVVPGGSPGRNSHPHLFSSSANLFCCSSCCFWMSSC